MRRPRGRTLIGTWAGTASALLLGLVLPSQAQGSCGDYLHRVPTQPGADTRADVPLPAPHTPCHGPTCSQQQSAPLPAPAPQPTSDSNDSAQLSTMLALLSHDGVESLVLPEPCPSTHLLGSIYRPPRSLSR